MRLFGTMMEGLGQALDLYQARHKVLAENVANADTPGYRARDLDFGAALAQAFESGSETGSSAPTAPAAPPEAVVDARATVKPDGNSVDIDTEMARMSENAMKMVALAQIISRKYTGLRSAITDGRS
jgi:flagellar basal-body rod protein FlgB